MYNTKGKISCTEVGRPNVSYYVLKNLATLRSTTRKPRHIREEGGKRANNGQLSKPDFSLMGDRQKKYFSKALVTNSDSVKYWPSIGSEYWDSKYLGCLTRSDITASVCRTRARA